MKSYYKTLSKEKQKEAREVLQMLDGDHAKPLIDLQKGTTFYVDGVKVRVKTLEKDGVKIKLDFWKNLDFGEMKTLLSCMMNSFPRNNIDIPIPETFRR